MSIRRTFSVVAVLPCVVFALTTTCAARSAYLPFDLDHNSLHVFVDGGMMDPGPGTDGTASLCINGPTVQLITYLGGSPDPGGVWTGPSATTGSFTPGTNVAGVYTYTQGGSSATVTVSVSNLSNAGTSATAPICSNAAPFALISKLTGSPQNTGAWTGPLNTSVSDTYTPGTSTPGIYTYTVPGISPCPSATATVTVQETTAPKAGTNTTINVCSSEASFPMRPRLNGSPDPGGSWVGPDGPHGTDFNPASDTPGAYVYTVTGTGPCANASATLTIQIVAAASAGTNGTIALCSTDGQYPLFSSLGGTPNVGGSWLGPTNAVHNGTFIPGTDAAGVYTYTVLGTTPCPPVSATVTVTVRAAANAGVGSSVSYCSDHAVVDLFTVLTGGPTAGGTWAGPGGSTSANFDPATSQPGAYTYTVAGQMPCPNAAATINVSVVPRANAGTNATVSKCSIDPSFSLFASLGGSPATGGTWTPPPGGPTTGTFTPGTSPAGVYTYTVIGNSPCTNGTATVTVNVTNAPIPGTNSTITRCSNAADVNLFLQLGGSPQSGGTWTRPDGTSHNGTYLPASQPGGNYTYTVAGTGPCAARSAIVQVVRVVAPNAGSNGNITVCSSDGPFEMIDVLGSSPNGTGTWRAPNGTTVVGEFTPGTSPSGTYKYVVVGAAPCQNDTGFVTVNVNPAPNAGTNTTITVCSDAATFPLFTQLGGTPQTGGTWTDPLGATHNGSFIPGTSLPGGYTYRKTGDTPCLAATAVVVVNVNRKPVAGTNGSFTRCSTDASVNIFSILGGTPDGGGVWTGPSTLTNGIFMPGTSTPGTYTYTVSGTAPCTNATATVIANVNMAPNAGTGGTITICPGSPSVDLFNGITGTPDLTGTWTELTTPGHVSGSFFDPTGLPAGDYDVRYTVSGGVECGNANTVVRVTIVPTLNAGSNGNLSACGSNTQVDLFNGLGGSPQAGGTWINLGGTGTLTGQYFNASSVSSGTYLFRYRLSGIAGCESDSAQVTLNIVEAPRAGNPGSTTTCSSAVPFSLFTLLGGNPMSGGIWHIGPATGPIMSGSYDPATNASGLFTYVVNGAAPCTSVTSTVTVTEIQGANAGTPASRSVCSNGAQFNMTNALGGTPDASGQWWFGGAHDPAFVPGLDIQGVYEYRVQGQAPCPLVTASLSVTVSEAANAGLNSSVTYCTGDGAQNMFFALTGDPDNGGSWRGITGANHSASFDPASDPIGNYKYIVTGSAPCVNDTAVLSVFLDPSPDAGGNGTAQLCIDGPAVNLINYLTGTPDPFGTWVGPNPLFPPFSGTFTPGTSVAGTYRYRVVNSCGTDSATVVVTVSTPANAGCSASINKCSSEGAFDMRAALGCNAAPSGTWTGPGPATGGVFTPGTSTPGVHTYTLGAVGGCAASSTTLTVAVFPVRNAGVDATRNLCRTDGQLHLFPLLGNSAQPGGVWRRNGVAHAETIDPATDLSGTYVYFLAANAGCPADSALVQINISTPPNAGNDGVITLCSSSPPYQLILSLSGNPQLNGTWTLPNSTTIHSGVFFPSSDPPGVYKYKRNGNAGCPADSSYVTVIVNPAVDAGGNGTRQVCSDAPQFHLFDNLGGNPQEGGVWFDPSNAAIAGDLYIPGTSVPGVYKYKLTGIAPCSSDSATVTVTQELAPDAGFSSLVNVCSSSDPFPLIGALGGTPQTGGTWSPVTDQPGIFNPSVDPGGAYTYTKSGISPCGTSTAQVVITLTQQANAGSNGSVSVCLGTTSVPLFPALNGTPSTGGVWTTPCPQGSLSNGEFNTTGMAAGTSCIITYTHAANGPCPAQSAQITVSVVDDLDAGEDNTIQACRSDLIALYSILAGSPQPGGSWINLDNASGFIPEGVFNTSSVAANTTWRFRYLLPGDSQCPADSAMVTVEVQEGPSAGCDGPTQSRCTSDVSFQLITFLGCTPDPGGSWFGPGPIAHSGTFNPATDVGGLYQYVVAGIGSCAADTATILINLTPTAFAGRDSSFLICSSSSILDMRPLLGPGVDPSGVWFRYDAVSTIHGPNYDPALDSTGIFFYVVQSLNACNPDTAWIFAFEYQAVFAGCSAEAEICAGNGEWTNLVTLLGCPPSGTGSWSYLGPDTVAHSGFFNPAVDLAGIYRYTVLADTPCTASEALLTITLIDIGDPGRDTVIFVCAGSAVVDLYNLLGPNVAPGGDWNDVDGSNALIDSLFDPAAAGDGTWHFQYWIQGNASCPARFSTITVVVGSSGFAGSDSTFTICNSLTTFDLFSALGPNALPGGTWLSPTGPILHWDPVSGILYPSSFDTTGALPEIVYQVTDPVCGTANAILRITLAPAPNVGGGGVGYISLCFTGVPINLFDTLVAYNEDNEPLPGGIWFNPFGFPEDGIYDPAEEPQGEYKYTFPESIGCISDTARVFLYLYYPPFAGDDTVTTICVSDTSYKLVNGLGGNPPDYGTWIAPTQATFDAMDNGYLDPEGLDPAEYEFTYFILGGGCANDTATLRVRISEYPALADIRYICDERLHTYQVEYELLGDGNGGFLVEGLEGTYSHPDSLPYVFTSVVMAPGELFTATITDLYECGPLIINGRNECDFEVAIFVPESFSPNGDGINESFQIPGIEAYPENTVVIFNRWGNKVFDAAGYDNNTVVWDGTSSKAVIGNSVPAGTYFYVIELDASTDAFKGSIQVVR
ncbi:MAG TPA: gliding motility-associated C-terminal domain-containing protein [Flavobacteriales bacterium]|nr:gliding motility-associated C-terminal domain-containing protein [Flavobacteriales bacterium]